MDELFEDTVPIEPENASDDEFGFYEDGLEALLGGSSSEGNGAGDFDALTGWTGYLEARPRVFLRDRDQGRNDQQLLLEGELELDFRLSDELTAYVRPRFFLDAFDGDLTRFEPYEAFLTYRDEDWDLRAGQFVENWGIVDTFNPIDVVNRRDFGTDALDTDRLGELGVRVRRFFSGGDVIGEPTLSLYALPVFRETLFPPEEQRFGLGSAFAEGGGFQPNGIEQALFAVRYQSTLQTPFANADIQALAARGPERAPTLFVGGGAQLPAYFGVATAGAGFRAVPNEEVAGRFLSTLTLKGEFVHKTPYTFDGSPVEAPDEYFTSVIGVDRSFFGLFTELDQLTVTVEFAKETGASDPSALLRPFREDLILRAFWEANDFARQSLEVRGLFDLDLNETIVELLYERQLRSIHPDVRLIVELRGFDTASFGESFFSLFPNNSSVAVGLRWDF